MKTVRKIADLNQHGWVKNQEKDDIEKVVEQFSVSITPQMITIINQETGDDLGPVAKQFVPTVKENIINSVELKDPIGDNHHSPVKGIVHRYPDRCLLMPIKVCPVYCRFCFRREQVGSLKGDNALTELELSDAFTYIKNHPEIWEVILTGGDPLILKPKKILKIMQMVDSISTVEVVRIHTRIPVVDSKRISEEMIEALKIKKATYVVLHANHPNEFTEAAVTACARIIDAGIPMLSQTVLLKDINDDSKILAELMRMFVKNRIKPYYLHQGDLAKGTSHFRVSLERGQEIVKSLRGNYSGLCQPTYVLDIPGGYGKVPIGHDYLNYNAEKACYCVEDYQGRIHEYKEGT